MTAENHAEPHDTAAARTAPSTCGAKTNSGKPCGRPAGWGTDHVGQGRCKLHGGATPIKHGRYSRIQRPRIRELLEEQENDADPLNVLPEVILLRGLIIDYVERYDEHTEALVAWHASFNGFDKQFEEWKERLARWSSLWEQFQTQVGEYRTAVEQAQTFYRQGWPEPPELPALQDPPLPPEPEQFAEKPRQVLDILNAAKFITQISTIVDRIERNKREGTISLLTLDRVMEQLGVEFVAAAQETIPDAAARAALVAAVERRWGSIHVDTVTDPPGGGSPTAAGARTSARSG